jgi:hypothetical protein
MAEQIFHVEIDQRSLGTFTCERNVTHYFRFFVLSERKVIKLCLLARHMCVCVCVCVCPSVYPHATTLESVNTDSYFSFIYFFKDCILCHL